MNEYLPILYTTAGFIGGLIAVPAMKLNLKNRGLKVDVKTQVEKYGYKLSGHITSGSLSVPRDQPVDVFLREIVRFWWSSAVKGSIEGATTIDEGKYDLDLKVTLELKPMGFHKLKDT